MRSLGLKGSWDLVARVTNKVTTLRAADTMYGTFKLTY